MNTSAAVDRLLEGWLQDSAPTTAPQGLHAAAIGAARGRRQRPAWLVAVRGGTIGSFDRPASVGAPTAWPALGQRRGFNALPMTVRIALLAGLALALVGGTLLAGGQLLRSHQPTVTNRPSIAPRAVLAPTPDLPFKTPTFVSAVSLPDGRVLIVGGLASGRGSIFDPATNTFTPTEPMLVARLGPAIALLPDGRVLIAGGQTFGPDPARAWTAEIFDPATGVFSATDRMASDRAPGHCGTQYVIICRPLATALNDGRILVTGGFSGSADLYDPSTQRFRSLAIGCTARGDVVTLSDGRVLTMCLSDLGNRGAIFDPATSSFSLTGSSTTMTSAGIAALLPDGRVLLAGEGLNGSVRTPGGIQPARRAGVFDPATLIFMPLDAAGNLDTASAKVILPDGRILVLGQANAMIFDPLTMTFSIAAGLSRINVTEPAAQLHDGRVVLFGDSTTGFVLDPSLVP